MIGPLFQACSDVLAVEVCRIDRPSAQQFAVSVEYGLLTRGDGFDLLWIG